MFRQRYKRWAQQFVALACLTLSYQSAGAQDVTCGPSDELSFGYSQLLHDRLDELRVSGDVRLCFQGTVVVAREMHFDRLNQRLWATGNIHMRMVDGTIVRAEKMEFGSQLRDAFAASAYSKQR